MLQKLRHCRAEAGWAVRSGSGAFDDEIGGHDVRAALFPASDKKGGAFAAAAVGVEKRRPNVSGQVISQKSGKAK
jgi:hypothetical protein